MLSTYGMKIDSSTYHRGWKKGSCIRNRGKKHLQVCAWELLVRKKLLLAPLLLLYVGKGYFCASMYDDSAKKKQKTNEKDDLIDRGSTMDRSRKWCGPIYRLRILGHVMRYFNHYLYFFRK